MWSWLELCVHIIGTRSLTRLSGDGVSDHVTRCWDGSLSVMNIQLQKYLLERNYAQPSGLVTINWMEEEMLCTCNVEATSSMQKSPSFCHNQFTCIWNSPPHANCLFLSKIHRFFVVISKFCRVRKICILTGTFWWPIKTISLDSSYLMYIVGHGGQKCTVLYVLRIQQQWLGGTHTWSITDMTSSSFKQKKKKKKLPLVTLEWPFLLFYLCHTFQCASVL